MTAVNHTNTVHCHRYKVIGFWICNTQQNNATATTMQSVEGFDIRIILRTQLKSKETCMGILQSNNRIGKVKCMVKSKRDMGWPKPYSWFHSWGWSWWLMQLFTVVPFKLCWDSVCTSTQFLYVYVCLQSSLFHSTEWVSCWIQCKSYGTPYRGDLINHSLGRT